MSELQLIHRRLQQARCPEDIFGIDPTAVKVTFRLLARAVHPDLHANLAIAGEASRLLNHIKQEADARIAARTWGQRLPLPEYQTITVGAYTVERTPLHGDIADIYRGESLLVKVARSHDDNDLIRAERLALTRLHSKIKTSVREGVPQLVDTLQVAGSAGWKREANVITAYPGFVTAEQIHHLVPAVAPQNLVWMFKRMLVLLEWVHHAGLVHGAILPPHLLFYPDNADPAPRDPRKHTLRLIDWCYAVEFKDRTRLSAWCPKWESFYPPELRDKIRVGPASDIYMAAKCIEYLGGSTVLPVELAGVIQRCLAPLPTRPADAGAVFVEWKKAAAAVYGTPQWFHFNLPQ